MDCYVILLEPENEGNIGAVARVMANFSFERLVLINPCELGEEAERRAKHAKSILKKAKILKKMDWKGYDTLIGTTGIRATEYNVLRTTLTPEKLRENLKGKKGKIGLLFGREGIGLKNQELENCGLVVSIPTSKRYPVMNISHAVAVVLYELRKREEKGYELANQKHKDQLLKIFKEVMKKIDYPEYRKGKTFISLKNLIGRSLLSSREATTLIGFFKKWKRETNG